MWGLTASLKFRQPRRQNSTGDGNDHLLARRMLVNCQAMFYTLDICGTVFYILNAIIGFGFMQMTMTMVTIALTNTLYRLAVVIVLAPAIGLLERIVCWLFPESKEAAAEREDMDRLESRFLGHPTLALAQSKTVIDSMAEKALESVGSAVAVRQVYSKPELKRVFDLEGVIDRYEDKLGSYLAKLTREHLSEEQSREVSKYLRVLSDFERISDHARNVGEAVEEIDTKKITFSESADAELRVLEQAVSDITTLTIEAFRDNDVSKALRIDPLEEVIDDMCDTLKANHIDRVARQECTLENGFVFNDLLTDYERVSDHCSNVAIDILESEEEEFNAHGFNKSMNYRQTDAYKQLFNEYKEKYATT